jgi:dipeptidyl aminopeptidase/acylaminoacyl peptidase
MTTYGIYEKEDVMTVLRHIEKHGGYERVVLWGRSMGAVAVVLAHS